MSTHHQNIYQHRKRPLHHAAAGYEDVPRDIAERIHRLRASQPNLQHADIARALRIAVAIVHRTLDD